MWSRRQRAEKRMREGRGHTTEGSRPTSRQPGSGIKEHAAFAPPLQHPHRRCMRELAVGQTSFHPRPPVPPLPPLPPFPLVASSMQLCEPARPATPTTADVAAVLESAASNRMRHAAAAKDPQRQCDDR